LISFLDAKFCCDDAIRLLLIAAVGVFPVHQAHAIDPGRSMSQYVRDRWGAEQGFPKGPVYAIAQTPDGYLWLGTEAGLVRFDGWNFNLVKDESGAVNVAGILGLTLGGDGCLWVRLQDLTVAQYCDGVFRRPASPERYFSISAMAETAAGKVLAWRMDAGAFEARAGAAPILAPAEKLPRSPVLALARALDGAFWVGTRDAGLFRFADGKPVAMNLGLPDLKVNCLLTDGDHDLWVGTDGGIVRWNGRRFEYPDSPAPAGRFQALALIHDRDGNVWVGTDSQGLLRFNSRGVASFGKDDELTGEAITALFEDREGNLWIAHAGGLERLRDSAFVTYSTAEGLPANGSSPVFVDAGGRVWFPPANGGLWWFDGDRRARVSSDGLDRDIVYSLAGTVGELWIGRQRGGLTRLRYSGDAFDAVTYTQKDGLAQNSVYSVYRARNGAVWAGGLSAGVSMLKNGRFTKYTVANGLASNTVASILEASDGSIWFATPSGLSSFVRGKWRTYGTADGLPSENVNCLLEDSAGILWAGTAKGIAFRIHDRFREAGSSLAALSDQLFGIAEDKEGALWISTSNHVLQVNREKLIGGAAVGDIHEYGLTDGLRGVEGVKRNRSVVSDSAGRIWFSMNRGISVVDPARQKENAAPAIPHIESIAADGVSIPIQGKVRIPGGSRRIVFRLAGLSLSVPEGVRYRYLLEKFDRFWSEPATNREAVYTNLGPGTYRLRVIASNAAGVWGSKEGVIAFKVDPLFWQTWWFGAGVVILTLSCLFALYSYRLQLISVRFRERLAERNRIAEELHDTLLQGFLSASMQVHVAADSLNADSTAKKTLNRALEMMQQVIEEGRNTIRGLRSPQSVSLDLAHAFSSIPQELGAQQKYDHQAAFRIIVEGAPRLLQPLVRDEIYRIGREALINALRHARANEIEMEIWYSGKSFTMLVRDDGCGIDPGVLGGRVNGHCGLPGMRQRADRMGAKLRVLSRAAAGTEIELSVPGAIAFQIAHVNKRRWFR
jgi:signal transduction histidine kinase/ligand-binding sensor domain-containing protein